MQKSAAFHPDSKGNMTWPASNIASFWISTCENFRGLNYVFNLQTSSGFLFITCFGGKHIPWDLLTSLYFSFPAAFSSRSTSSNPPNQKAGNPTNPKVCDPNDVSFCSFRLSFKEKKNTDSLAGRCLCVFFGGGNGKKHQSASKKIVFREIKGTLELPPPPQKGRDQHL